MPFNPIDIQYRKHNASSETSSHDDDVRGSYESHLDLNEYCISHPSSTFFIKVEGDTMEGVGIFHGDLLIVDRALEPAHGRIVVMVIAGEFAVRKLIIRHRQAFLASGVPSSELFEITPDTDASIWGIVIGVIHRF